MEVGSEGAEGGGVAGAAASGADILQFAVTTLECLHEKNRH